MRSIGVILVVLLLFACASAPEPVPEEDEWEDDWDEEEDEGADRVFLYKEAVLSAFYSPEGVVGIPPDDRTEDHFEFSPRPPGTYVGADLVGTLSSSTFPNETLLPSWMPLRAFDLHPRIIWDRLEESGSGSQVKVVPQDFWLRFHPGNVDRLTLRIGQFVIPYGADPVMSPRHMFILPIEATDIGFKWDWGIDLRGPLGEYDWEVAATMGTGEAMHPENFFGGPGHRNYLLTGRVGSPAYWDFRNGISFLYGRLPLIMAYRVATQHSMARWRVGVDSTYKHGTYLMFGGQVTFGQDGFQDDAEFVPLSEDEVVEVLGYRAWADWVVPWHEDLRLATQLESVIRNMDRSDADSTAVIFEVGYSISTAVSVKLDYRIEISQPIGERYDAIYLTLVYYTL